MLAGIYNIYCEQGTTFVRIFDIETPDPEEQGVWNPLDITGYTARMQIKRLITDAEPMIELTTENGGIIIQDEDVLGRISIFMSAEQTSGIPTNGVYDIEIISADELVVERPLKGKFILDPEVTT
jgi:hypothetical protein